MKDAQWKINNSCLWLCFSFLFSCRVSLDFLVPRVSQGFQDSQELRWVTLAPHCDVVYASVGGRVSAPNDTANITNLWWWDASTGCYHVLSAWSSLESLIPLSFCSHYLSLSLPFEVITPLWLRNVTWKWSEWDNPLPLPFESWHYHAVEPAVIIQTCKNHCSHCPFVISLFAAHW